MFSDTFIYFKRPGEWGWWYVPLCHDCEDY
jgi:hypothetical protein